MYVRAMLCDNFCSSVKELSPAVKGQGGDLCLSAVLCVCVSVRVYTHVPL